MARYDKLDSMLLGMTRGTAPRLFEDRVIPYITDLWLSEYERSTRTSRIVETLQERFRYLFDIEHERLIAAWGISAGRHSGARPKARMAGHPLSDGPAYHRGHAIPHTLGGGTDINLVPQNGAVNVGPFRELEKAAVATPGALYFTHWIYGAGASQRPRRVEQGLLVPGQPSRINTFAN